MCSDALPFLSLSLRRESCVEEAPLSLCPNTWFKAQISELKKHKVRQQKKNKEKSYHLTNQNNILSTDYIEA